MIKLENINLNPKNNVHAFQKSIITLNMTCLILHFMNQAWSYCIVVPNSELLKIELKFFTPYGVNIAVGQLFKSHTV